MNRREVLNDLTAAVPGLSASADIEDAVGPMDLIVISTPNSIGQEMADHIRTWVEHLWKDDAIRPKVIVISDGLTLQVHRGIAKVEIPQR